MSTPRAPQRRSDSALEEGSRPTPATPEKLKGVALAALRFVAARRLELLTLLALVGGGLLVISEFLTLLQVKTQLGVIFEQTGGAHHSYALLVIGFGVIAAALVARSTEAEPSALGIAALGALALGIVLIGDLPDVGSSGITRNGQLGNAHAASGFWVELAGSLVAIAAGAVLWALFRRRKVRRRSSRHASSEGPS